VTKASHSLSLPSAKRFLVTGATGFIGRHLVKILSDRGHIVVAVARGTPDTRLLGWGNSVECIPHDIAAPIHDPRVIFGDIDAVIHLAWSGLPNYNDSFHYEKNLFDSYAFLKKIIQAGYRRVFVSGTCFEYGLHSGELAESLEGTPVTAYGLAKQCLFRFLKSLQRFETFQLIWGRLFYLYGEGQNPKSLLCQLQQAIEREDDEFLMSGGEQLRDYLLIQDACTIIADLLEIEKDVGAVNICSGKPRSVRSFVESWLRDHGKSIGLKLGHYPYVDYEPLAFWGSRSKLDRLLQTLPAGLA
jgi:nucleoside-diphosphate-sugar epimerase